MGGGLRIRDKIRLHGVGIRSTLTYEGRTPFSLSWLNGWIQLAFALEPSFRLRRSNLVSPLGYPSEA